MPKKRQMRGRRAAARMARPPLERLKDTWSATRKTLTAAERRVEKEARGMLKRNKIGRREAAQLFKGLRSRALREQRKALAGLQTLQHRINRESKAFARTVGETVQSTLAAFNIPSRLEITDLTHRVEALTRKLDERKPAARKRAGHKRAARKR